MKQNQNSTSRAIVAAENTITAAINPKPTKTELIKALALREQQRQAEANQRAREEREKQNETCQQLLCEFVRLRIADLSLSVNTGYVYGSNQGAKLTSVSVAVDFDDGNKLPPTIERELRKLHAIQTPSILPIQMIERKIRKRIIQTPDTGERVMQLLKSPEVKEALDKMLDSFN